MAGSSGPNIVNDGLVFAYDMAPNPGISRSWKGMPVTNVVTNTNLDTGWSKGYNTSIQFNDYSPPNGINSQVVSFIDADGNGSGYWYSYGDYAPQDPSTTYCISIWARTVGSDWSMAAYTADNSETGRQYTNYLTCPGDGEWHRLEFNAITTPSNTTSDSLSFFFNSIPAGQRCWLCAPQMTATSFHVPFVAGTRSNTQALLDWTGNYTITVSSLTYNSDGTFSFNNSNNVIETNFPAQTLNNSTICAWVYDNTADTNYRAIVQHNTASDDALYVNPSNKLMWWPATASTLTVPKNQWVFVAASHTYGSGILYQVNNTQEFISGTFADPTDWDFLRIGGYSTGDGERWGGYIPIVKVYNRALTAAEVTQNFTAGRSRYGL